MNVLILSGISGAGKSTFANKILGNKSIYSADNYFIDSEGNYKFDYKKLSDAHNKCLRDFCIGVINNKSLDYYTIVVDNTNTTAVEIAPYYALASSFECKVTIVNFDVDPELAFKRNVHGVPLASINNMNNRLLAERKKFPPWWNQKSSDKYPDGNTLMDRD